MRKSIVTILRQTGEIIDWIPRIGIVVAIVGAVGLVIKQWIDGIDTTQLALLLVILFGILLLILGLILKWSRGRSIHSIPKLLLDMDERMKWLIEVSPHPSQENAEKFIGDAGELLQMDFSRFKDAYKLKDVTTMKSIIKETADKAVPLQSFKEVLDYLTKLKGLMNFDGIGLDLLKDKEFKKMEARLISLKHRIPDSKTTRRLNVYLLWWEGSMSFQLLNKFPSQNTAFLDFLPVQAKTTLPNINQLVNLATDEYLGYVKDGIYGKS